MIGLDMDGTLLNDNKEITPYTKRVLEQAMEEGVLVLLATGRPISAIQRELSVFPKMKYAVTANGGRIVDLTTKKDIYTSLLPVDRAEKVLDVLADYDNMYEIFVDGVGYTKKSCMEHLENYFENPSMIEYVLKTRNDVEDVKEALLQMNQPVDKVHGVFAKVSDREAAMERMQSIEGITASGAFDNSIEVNMEGTNKGQALLRLGEILGIKREEIMACGDGMNDYEMLKAVGFGVAMENGNPKLKEIADYVTVSNNEDGVAKAIESFVLKRKGNEVC